jgi:hypothetical protein
MIGLLADRLEIGPALVVAGCIGATVQAAIILGGARR